MKEQSLWKRKKGDENEYFRFTPIPTEYPAQSSDLQMMGSLDGSSWIFEHSTPDFYDVLGVPNAGIRAGASCVEKLDRDFGPHAELGKRLIESGDLKSEEVWRKNQGRPEKP